MNRRNVPFRSTLVLAVLGALALTVWWATRPPPLPPLTLSFTDGRQTSLADFRGRPLVLDFWSVDCPICLADMPALAALLPEIEARGARLIGVNIPQDPPPAIMAAAATLAPPWPLALDPRGELAAAVGGIVGTPTLIILDREGRVHQRLVGELDADALLAALDTLN
jgi:peroxiredoxin